MIRVLTEDERKAYHARYRGNDLFRSWKSVLARHEKSDLGIDPMSIWAHSDILLQELRNTSDERPEMAEELCLEALRENDENQVVAVMATMVVRLMNATERGHEDDVIPNDALCLAIMSVMQKHKLFKSLIDELFVCKVGYDGQEIVITPHNPMMQSESYDDLPETTQQDIENKVQYVLQLTNTMKQFFKDEWTNWEKLWRQILTDTELAILLDKVSPRKNEWKKNQKMICNIAGLFIDARNIKVSLSEVSTIIANGKSVKTYLLYPTRFGSSESAFVKVQYNKVDKLLQAL